MSKMNKPRLGRGLSSLLSMDDEAAESPAAPTAAPQGKATEARGGEPTPPPPGTAVLDLDVNEIRPNPHQPRREFDDASIAELAASLKSTGLIQPVIVRRTAAGYELIAGERRLRAAKHANLATLPAIVKDVDTYTQAQMALVENIQRQDLNPIDRAVAYRTLLEQLGLTHGELAGRLGEDRSVISHYVRLLDLAEPVRDMIRSAKLALGHGKLLAGLSDKERQQELADRVVSQGLSVRNLERLLETPASTPPEPAAGAGPSTPSAHLRDLEQTMTRHLGMKVQVRWSPKRGRGKLVIFYDLNQFDALKERLGVVTD